MGGRGKERGGWERERGVDRLLTHLKKKRGRGGRVGERGRGGKRGGGERKNWGGGGGRGRGRERG